MTSQLVDHAYGKVGIRLAKVERDGEDHRFHDLTVRVRLLGDFSLSYAGGDNSTTLPTDTMKNTAYVVAQDTPLGEVERYAEALLRRLLASAAKATSAQADVLVHSWERLDVDGVPHPHAFRAAPSVGTASVVVHRDGPTRVTSGIDELVLLKTTASAYTGFLVDDLTTLAETDDRILATSVQASWTWLREPLSYRAARDTARGVLETVFATQHSLAVQHTLHAMAVALLERVPEIAQVRLVLPNRHHVPVDLSPFGRANAGEVFVVLDRPAGLIEGTVARGNEGQRDEGPGD